MRGRWPFRSLNIRLVLTFLNYVPILCQAHPVSGSQLWFFGDSSACDGCQPQPYGYGKSGAFLFIYMLYLFIVSMSTWQMRIWCSICIISYLVYRRTPIHCLWPIRLSWLCVYVALDLASTTSGGNRSTDKCSREHSYWNYLKIIRK